MLSVSFGHHPAQCAQWLHSPGSRNRDQGAGRRSLSKWLHLRAEHETLTHTHPYSTINTAYRETTTQERERERESPPYIDTSWWWGKKGVGGVMRKGAATDVCWKLNCIIMARHSLLAFCCSCCHCRYCCCCCRCRIS